MSIFISLHKRYSHSYKSTTFSLSFSSCKIIYPCSADLTWKQQPQVLSLTFSFFDT
nr:MAG TPA: hypothetical protein [Bacteriophage sp.]